MAALPLPLQITLNQLQTSSTRLQQDGATWIHRAETVRTPNDILCRVVHYIANARHIFIIVDYSKVITTTTISRIVGLPNVQADWLKTAGRETTVTDILQSAAANPATLEFVLTARMVADTNMIVPLTRERCVCISYEDFQNNFAVIGPISQHNFSPEPQADFDVVRQSVQQGTAISDINILDNTLHKTAILRSLDSMEVGSEAISAKLAATNQNQNSTRTQFNTLKQDYDAWKGPITEHAIREYIAKREGFAWATGRELDSLESVLQWIGGELDATPQTLNFARESIVRSCIHGFDGFSEDDHAMVSQSRFVCG